MCEEDNETIPKIVPDVKDGVTQLDVTQTSNPCITANAEVMLQLGDDVQNKQRY